jgi:hypothetical protein
MGAGRVWGQIPENWWSAWSFHVTMLSVTKKQNRNRIEFTGTCQECGRTYTRVRDIRGSKGEYCSGRCRMRAFRKRKVPAADELRDELRAELDAAAVGMAALRAVLAGLEVPELEAARRHLAALARTWEGLPAAPVRDAPTVPVPAAPAEDSVTDGTVTVEPVTTPAPTATTWTGGKLGGLTPTAEQAAILDAVSDGRHLVVEAGAGTGKTSTLRMVGEMMGQRRRRGLYIAFNRPVAKEAAASFPANVSCSTAHSLAFRAIGYAYKARLDGPRIPARRAAELLDVSDSQRFGDVTLAPAHLARLAMDTVAQYCRTADDEVSPRHVPQVNGIDGAAAEALRDAVYPLAVRAWDDLRRPDGSLRFTHDCYLKMWALTRPQLRTDVIFFDEAQDADPLVASVVQAQRNTQLIAVGDTEQAIYEWRGAIDAIQTWPAETRLYLTQSWRFGPAVAEEANKWLALLNARLRLTGAPTVRSVVGRADAPRAILARTNAETIKRAMEAMAAGRRVALVGGGQAIAKLARAAADLQAGKATDHPELFAFKSWAEVQEYVREEQDAGELATMVRLVDDHGTDEILTATRRLVDERSAEITISTAHRAKGREWTSVQIADDWRQPSADENGRVGQVPKGEARLAYVAVTRAKRTLDRGGLAWIDDQLAGRGRAPRRRRPLDAGTDEDWYRSDF